MDFLKLENKIVCQKLKIKCAMEDIKENLDKNFHNMTSKEIKEQHSVVVAGAAYIAALEFVHEELYKD